MYDTGRDRHSETGRFPWASTTQRIGTGCLIGCGQRLGAVRAVSARADVTIVAPQRGVPVGLHRFDCCERDLEETGPDTPKRLACSRAESARLRQAVNEIMPPISTSNTVTSSRSPRAPQPLR